MKSKVTWLLPVALLIVFHGSLTAQKGSDAHEWLTTADRSALLAEQKDALSFSSPANVKYHGRWFTTTLPEESVGTYVW